jgi:hypothetical protein
MAAGDQTKHARNERRSSHVSSAGLKSLRIVVAMDANTKYPWQKAVVAAIVEFRPECLPEKIKTAERAIALRLCDPEKPGLDEHRMLANALRALRVINPTSPQGTRPKLA